MPKSGNLLLGRANNLLELVAKSNYGLGKALPYATDGSSACAMEIHTMEK